MLMYIPARGQTPFREGYTHIQLRPARKSLQRGLTEGVPTGSIGPMQEMRRLEPYPASRSSYSVRGHYTEVTGATSHSTTPLRGQERA